MPSITDRLISFISELSEEQQKTIIGEIARRLSKEKRRYPRKSVTTFVDFAFQGRSYREFVKDMSASGAFIQASGSFSKGNEVTLTFSIPKSQKQLKIKGRVTRVTDNGIGVEFRRKVVRDQSTIDSPLEML